MPDRQGDVPPTIRSEWCKGTALAIAAVVFLLLVVLFIALGDDIFSRAAPEETNMSVHTGG